MDSTAPDAPLLGGSVIGGQFRIVRELAQGGMGTVYVAEQIGTGKLRALKRLQPALATQASSRERFVREARISARIESEHVVDVIAAGVDESQTPWLAMELLRGEDLERAVVRHGPFAPFDARALFAQLCDALAAAHKAGVVHRDLKPANVFLSAARPRGLPFTVKVLDFGIAKLVREGDLAQTQAIGTPYWMAPEQATRGGTITAATDVWALGLLAFYVLTGKPFWRSAQHDLQVPLMAALYEITSEPVDLASARATEIGARAPVPPEFDAWFAHCVDREPTARFETIGEAHAVLDRILAAAGERGEPFVLREEPIDEIAEPAAALTESMHSHELAPALSLVATQGPVAAPSPDRTRSRRWRKALVGLAILVVAAGAEIGFWLRHRAQPSAAGARASNPSEREEVRLAVRALTPQIRSCYDAALAEHPDLDGHIRVHFRVEPSGRVEGLMSGGDDAIDRVPQLRVCVEHVLRGLSLRPRAAAMDVTYPFQFRAATNDRSPDG